ncbi:unnamed protein product, partial [Medioppia subpectinata]
MFTKLTLAKLITIYVYLLSVFNIYQCQVTTETTTQKTFEQKVLDNQKKGEENLKTLSRSKASVWVDTNKGNIFSTSIGSSHIEKDKNGNNGTGAAVGRSSNMLLTLMIQPGGQ